MEWIDVGRYIESDIGSAIKHGRKWFGTYNYLKHDTFKREYFENCKTADEAKAAVIEAYRRDLEAKAALIGCKIVDDDTIETLNELVLDAFNAACRNADGTYDNMLMSTWIAAQEYLIRTGMIDADKCIRKQPAPAAIGYKLVKDSE